MIWQCVQPGDKSYIALFLVWGSLGLGTLRTGVCPLHPSFATAASSLAVVLPNDFVVDTVCKFALLAS